MEVKIINFSDLEIQAHYQTLLNQSALSFCQQESDWIELVKNQNEDTPFLVSCFDEDRLIAGMLIYLFSHSKGNVLFTNPQLGSIGNLIVKDGYDLKSILEKMVPKIDTFSKENNCLSYTIASQPFFDQSIFDLTLNYDYSLYNELLCVDLNCYFNDDNSVALKDYNKRSQLSRSLKKGINNGFYTEETKEKKDLDAWYEQHIIRCKEHDANIIPQPFLYDLYNYLIKNDLGTLLVLKKSDKIIGGGIFVYSNHIVDIYRMSTSKVYQNQGANYVFIDFAIKWAREKGARYFNWQASNPPSGGIFNFKMQWGSSRIPYKFYTKLLDSEKIQETITLDSAKEIYRNTFIVPYAFFENPSQKDFNKDSAPCFLPNAIK